MCYWGGIQNELGVNPNLSDVCISKMGNKHIKINTDFKTHRKPVHAELNIYTDGSKMANKVGSGFVVIKSNKVVMTKSFRLPDHCTVFQAEIMAIKQAACYLMEEENAAKYVRFFVDSQAAILALNSDNISSQLVRQTKSELNEAGKQRYLILNWTRAHIGTEGNELADTAAKAGSEMTSPLVVGFPKAHLTEQVEKYFYNLWEKEFQNYDGARMGKLFYKRPDKIKAKYVCKLSRARLARFIRIISGHNSLFYFRSKVDPDIRPTCRFCLENIETFDHLINDCPRFNTYRREFFYDIKIQNDHEWNIQTLIDFSYLPGINHALEGDTDLGWYGEGNWDHEAGSLSDSEGVG